MKLVYLLYFSLRQAHPETESSALKFRDHYAVAFVFGMIACSPLGPLHEEPVKINWWKIHLSCPNDISGFSSGCLRMLRLPPYFCLELILVNNVLSGISSMWISTISNPCSFFYLKPLPGNSKPSFSYANASSRLSWYHRYINHSLFRYRAVWSFRYFRLGRDSLVSTKNLVVLGLYWNPQHFNHSQTVDRDGVLDIL